MPPQGGGLSNLSGKWSEVTEEHVLQAIRKYDGGGTGGYAKNTYLRHARRLYPAKHIRALAYEVAFGESPDRSTFSGGQETVTFFEKLGFSTDYRPDRRDPPEREASQTRVLAEDSDTAVSPDKAFDWRSFELDLQRIRLVYLKWLLRYSPEPCAALEACKYNGEVYAIDSPYGRSFSLSPAGWGLAYAGGGRGNVRLSAGSYAAEAALAAETERIKSSLDARVRQLKRLIKRLILGGDRMLAWEYMQNFWWLRLGMHEYVYDVHFRAAKLPSGDVRDYVLASMYSKIDLSDGAPPPFTDDQILNSLRHQFAWDRYGCCSYDCGPIALGKRGFVPYKVAAAHIRQYFADNSHALKSAMTRDDKRDFAADSLRALYDFPVLYHRLGFLKLADLAGRKDELVATIAAVDAHLASATQDMEAHSAQ